MLRDHGRPRQDHEPSPNDHASQPAETTSAATAWNGYVFVRPAAVGGLGHVGWGFVQSATTCVFGGTENTGSWPVVLPGFDNAAWHRHDSFAQMLTRMRARGYSYYKVCPGVGFPQRALNEAVRAEGSGYVGVANNCMDHAYNVLTRYGVIPLPWPSHRITPNSWFDMISGPALVV